MYNGEISGGNVYVEEVKECVIIGYYLGAVDFIIHIIFSLRNLIFVLPFCVFVNVSVVKD